MAENEDDAVLAFLKRRTFILSLNYQTSISSIQRMRNSAYNIEPLSPEKETSASESYSADMTQQILYEESLATRLLPFNKAETKDAKLSTSSSLTKSTLSVQIPNILKCDIILTSNLLNQNHIINELLFNYNIAALPPPTNPSTEEFTSSFKSKPQRELVILVEFIDTYVVDWNTETLIHHVLH